MRTQRSISDGGVDHRGAIAWTALAAAVLCAGLWAASPGLAAADDYTGDHTHPAPDRWTSQYSARIGMGFGKAMGKLESELLYENVIRAEALFGKPGDEHFRFGPALELRSVDLDTIEYAGGAQVLIPAFRGYPIQISALAGYAHRRRIDTNGGIFVGTFAWGYRSYNYHSRYGLGVNAYVSSRVHLNDPSKWEITAGLSFDLGLAVIPVIGITNIIAKRGDPDEPVTHEPSKPAAPAAPALRCLPWWQCT